jgi:hypothetical protein
LAAEGLDRVLPFLHAVAVKAHAAPGGRARVFRAALAGRAVGEEDDGGAGLAVFGLLEAVGQAFARQRRCRKARSVSRYCTV